MEIKQSSSLMKYIAVFIITVFIFVIASYLSDFFTNKKIQSIKTVQDKIFMDLLSSETQFSLLQDIPCNSDSGSIVSPEINSLSQRIASSERSSSISDDEVTNLKKYYTILEIKDYLLMKKINERCSLKNEFILFFYETENCPLCIKQEYALDDLRNKYPQFRVYSFDTKLDLSALRSMISIYKPEKDAVSWIVINGKVYTGLKLVEDIEKFVPNLKNSIKKNTPSSDKSNSIDTNSNLKAN